MNSEITLDRLIEFIRNHQRISKEIVIDQNSFLEKDLGITGDDGEEFLEAIERGFVVSFAGSNGTIREAFGLEKDEYLFHSEGIWFFRFIASFFGRDVENVKPLTVGELYRIVLSAKTANATS